MEATMTAKQHRLSKGLTIRELAEQAQVSTQTVVSIEKGNAARIASYKAIAAVLGVDLVPIKPLPMPQVRTAVLDVLADGADAKLVELEPGWFDAVISDMAPKTSGIRDTDEARSIRLAERALEIARARGKPGGAFICKLFMGRDFEAFRGLMREAYEEVKVVRPEATRGASVEVYLVGLRKRT
jgi:23S rRNA (uridine2552-2'-O)-methyltransferase